MKYPDGREVKRGDHVKLGSDSTGVVVCSIDRDEYSENHPKEQWAYLKTGVMIEFKEYGLIHFTEPDPDLELLDRESRK